MKFFRKVSQGFQKVLTAIELKAASVVGSFKKTPSKHKREFAWRMLDVINILEKRYEDADMEPDEDVDKQISQIWEDNDVNGIMDLLKGSDYIVPSPDEQNEQKADLRAVTVDSLLIDQGAIHVNTETTNHVEWEFEGYHSKYAYNVVSTTYVDDLEIFDLQVVCSADRVHVVSRLLDLEGMNTNTSYHVCKSVIKVDKNTFEKDFLKIYEDHQTTMMWFKKQHGS